MASSGEKKARVYEVAKAIGIDSKELLRHLKELGVEVKSHMSTIDAETSRIIQDTLNPREEEKPPVEISESATIGELAEKTGLKPNEIIKKLMGRGIFVSINEKPGRGVLEKAAGELGIEIRFGKQAPGKPEPVKVKKPKKAEKDKPLKPRCPIVVVMGHVDHGKTLLLDCIRRTNVAEREKGGITQQIGASKISSGKGEVVFIDTPGHEAFTSMRERGAGVTDIAVLVVAADDGVMPQTVEAIHHAREADVPIIVAINKMDRPQADSQRIRIQLQEHGIVTEDFGGEVICTEVSALKNQGIGELLDMILLQAELMELKCDPSGKAEGTVIEARLDRYRGPLATVIIQKGVLKPGDYFISGDYGGKVRAMFSWEGKRIPKALPSTPVEIIGFGGVPMAGDSFSVVENEKEAKGISSQRRLEKRERDLGGTQQVSLEEFFEQAGKTGAKELKLIIKADTRGAAEALTQSLGRLGNESAGVSIIHSQTGQIGESDIMFASASNAVIIGFNVGMDSRAKELNASKKVDVRLYYIIYDVINDVTKSLEGLLEPKITEVATGKAQIRQVFETSKGTIAGAYVVEGKITRNSPARLLRQDEEVVRGSISSLKRFKNDAREVEAGLECGIGLSNFADYREGDIIETYKTLVEKSTL